MSSSWNSPALIGQYGRVGNRSDAIILPPSQWGEVKFVRPNSCPGNCNGDDSSNTRYLSPDMEYKKGFLVKSTNPATYSLNFPTTGADKLYFDLYIEGIGVDELIWEPVSHEGITASMELIKRGDFRRWVYHWSEREILDNNDVTLIRVTLTGPDGFSQRHNPYPSRITVPRLPQTFELVGKDSYGNAIIKYGFVLQK
ncbi:hypothetical protein [Gilliamella sp. Pas-s25]|uniref:hypothetical protein n=1 Tax=Gilliamella sp. Pas-s25 TaxID=2687310 RepID=UPI00135EECB4|nr:hypothetical protein [Gilliamella sp. Pas-s25]MWP62043.1 hypothetical protein [Gilliamella sp. Pas-s25]